jgi:uncharacterized membrane protein YjdF
MPSLLKRQPLLCIVTIIYMLAGIAISFVTRNWEFLGYMAQMAILIALIIWADRRARFSTSVLWGLSLWGILHLCGGVVPVPREMAQLAEGPNARAVLYGLWIIPPNILKYDNLVHAWGFFITTLACWQALRRWLKPGEPITLAFFVILACAGMGLGSINEIIEFAATRFLKETGVGGYVNNSIDLIYNALGAITAAVVVWAKRQGGN